MDPLQFAMHSDIVGEVLGTIVILSLIVERALAPFFEWNKFLQFHETKNGSKEPIAIVVSIALVWIYGFDALAIIFSEENSSWYGYILTGSIIAGGSKGSVKLFREWLGWKSEARKAYENKKQDNSES
jgi:hypothetical protein